MSDDEEEQFEVQKILDKKTVNGEIKYLLKWKGYSDRDNSWVKESKLDCSILVAAFEKNRIENILGMLS